MLVCVVTGGSRGIGLAIVHTFLKKITQKMVVYNLDLVEPQDDISLLAMRQEQLKYLPTNVSKPQELISRLQDDIFSNHQRLDCLVNNAGMFESEENHNVLWDDDTTVDQIDYIIDTNLKSVIHGTRTVVKSVKSSGGNGYGKDKGNEDCTRRTIIINIASTAAFGPFPMHPVYCSTKSAVLQFTQTAQIDLQSRNEEKKNGIIIAVYAICPGITDTEMGRMGGSANRQAVAQLRNGKRTSPELVATAVWGLFQQSHPQWNQCSYLIVDNHTITPVPPTFD